MIGHEGPIGLFSWMYEVTAEIDLGVTQLFELQEYDFSKINFRN